MLPGTGAVRAECGIAGAGGDLVLHSPCHCLRIVSIGRNSVNTIPNTTTIDTSLFLVFMLLSFHTNGQDIGIAPPANRHINVSTFPASHPFLLLIKVISQRYLPKGGTCFTATGGFPFETTKAAQSMKSLHRRTSNTHTHLRFEKPM